VRGTLSLSFSPSLCHSLPIFAIRSLSLSFSPSLCHSLPLFASLSPCFISLSLSLGERRERKY